MLVGQIEIWINNIGYRVRSLFYNDGLPSRDLYNYL